MAEISKEKQKSVSKHVFLDEEAGDTVELFPVKSSQVFTVGWKDEYIYIQYRDAIWRYETPSAKDHFEKIMHLNEIGSSVGKYVTAKVKPLPGKKVAVTDVL